MLSMTNDLANGKPVAPIWFPDAKQPVITQPIDLKKEDLVPVRARRGVGAGSLGSSCSCARFDLRRDDTLQGQRIWH
jgi:hypothetical protein